MFRIFFFFPLSYVTYSRLKSFKEWVSWVYLFPLFCFLSYAYYIDVACTLTPWLRQFLLLFFAVLSTYEIGYLYNDLWAVKVENSPTLRVQDPWFVTNFYNLVGARIAFIVVMLVVAYFYSGQLCIAISLFEFVFLLNCLGIAFYFHNVVRGPANIFTFCLLSFLKYFAVLFVISDKLFFVVVFLSFTLIRTLEYGSVKRYITGRFAEFVVSDIDLFRVVYYGIIFFTISVFSLFDLVPWDYLFVVCYFLFYRIGIYAFVRRAAV